jgi:hypothetical protein
VIEGPAGSVRAQAREYGRGNLPFIHRQAAQELTNFELMASIVRGGIAAYQSRLIVSFSGYENSPLWSNSVAVQA